MLGFLLGDGHVVSMMRSDLGVDKGNHLREMTKKTTQPHYTKYA